MRSLGHTGPAQRRKPTACACTSTSLWPKIRSAPGATVPACVCSRGADVGSFRFQRMQPNRTCLRVSVSEWLRYKKCAGFGFGAHNSVADGTVQFRHVQSMGCIIFSAHVPAQMWAGFVGVVHAVRACMGGLQFQCASSATVSAGVSFSAQPAANAASFGFLEFRQTVPS